jgi:RNA polymerase sigma-70 factor, ECF subfamily
MGMRTNRERAGDGGEEARFARLYAANGRHVLAYALRRTARPEDAADVVSETFLVAWRRLDDVPSGEEVRPWLFGVARRVLANQRRGEQRRDRLSERLRNELATLIPAEVAPEPETAAMRVLGRMDPRDREVLLLAGWEGLGPSEIARVMGISRPAARNRLHRARARFRRDLEAAEEQPARHAGELEPREAR